MRKLGSLSAGLALLLTLGAREAAAQPAGYLRANGIGVNNATGGALANYQVRLVINTQTLINNGQMRADANDMVFTLGQCGAGVLGHWIESGVNTANTVVWVKVPSLAVGVNRLTIWYSNAGAAPTSNPSRVFIGQGVANDPISSTQQVTVPSSLALSNVQRGFRFTTNVQMLVVDFGKREPDGVAKYVTLFDFNSQSIIRQVVVSGAAATYSYAPTQPFWLDPGRDLVLEIYSNTGNSHYYGPSTQISPDLTYTEMRYCNSSCTQDTFPAQILTAVHHGIPDLRYFKRLMSSPEPNQVTVAGNCAQTSTCDGDCSAVACGDGFINTNANEACDDGNAVNTDACAACQNARCGDGFVRSGSEQCDDGNSTDTDACRNNCQSARCGDGVVQAGTDQCDDGNSTDTDACRNNCQSARCGDGVVHAGVEQCDDGNSTDTDACRNNCTNNTGMGGAGGMSGSGGTGGASGASGANTGGTSTGGRGGTSTGGRGGTSAGTTGGGEGGEAGADGESGAGGESAGGATATGGRATGGRAGSTATGGRATGGTSAPGGEGGEGDTKPEEETFARQDPGCGCTTPGSQSDGRTAAVLALLGLGWAANARRRGSRRAAR